MMKKGAVDVANDWKVGGNTRHIDTRLCFPCGPKEDDVLVTSWTDKQ